MKIIDKIPIHKSPNWFKLLIAKFLIRCMSIDNLENDIVLYNALDLYIKTKTRPITSNPNYWINKK